LDEPIRRWGDALGEVRDHVVVQVFLLPAPTEVIVVHQGHLSCGAVDASTGDKGVTQVVPVNNRWGAVSRLR
jgi:hypothetical protein